MAGMCPKSGRSPAGPIPSHHPESPFPRHDRGSDPDPQGAPEQPGQRRRRHPAQPTGCDHGRVGLGQELARVRHALPRGPAALPRDALGVCAAVPGRDGEARRRVDRGPLAGDRCRPALDRARGAFDGRDADRGRRSPARGVRARGAGLLPGVQEAGRGPDAGGDRAVRAARARGAERAAAGALDPRQEGAPPRVARRTAQAGLRARARRWEGAAARGGSRARALCAPHDRCGRRSAEADRGRGRETARGARAGARARQGRRAAAVPPAGASCRCSSRVCSRSTRRTAPAPTARAWASRRSSRSARSSPIRRSRSATARWR